MRRRVLPAALTAAMVTAAVAAGEPPRFEEDFGFHYRPPPPGSYVLHRLRRMPDGWLLDVRGRRVRLSEVVRGRIALMGFAYTRCGDPQGCPLLLDRLFAVHDLGRRDAELPRHLVIVLISLDPAHDRPELLRALEESVDPGGPPWRWLTVARPEALTPLLEAFDQPVMVTRSGRFYHLLRLYLVDRTGWIREIYGLGFLDPRVLVNDVRTLLLEEERAGAGRPVPSSR